MAYNDILLGAEPLTVSSSRLLKRHDEPLSLYSAVTVKRGFSDERKICLWAETQIFRLQPSAMRI